jgi:hypothetical protein
MEVGAALAEDLLISSLALLIGLGYPQRTKFKRLRIRCWRNRLNRKTGHLARSSPTVQSRMQ